MKKQKNKKETDYVLKALEERGIDLIDEVWHLYGISKKVVVNLYLKWSAAQDDPEQRNKKIEEILTGAEMQSLQFNQRQCFTILQHLFEFTYAKQKAIQFSQKVSEAIVFNIDLGNKERVQKLAGQSSTVKQPEALNVSYKEIESK